MTPRPLPAAASDAVPDADDRRVRSATEALVAPFSPEDCQVQSQEPLPTDLKHALSFNADAAYARPRPAVRLTAAAALDRLRRGLVGIGHDPALDGGFAYDNETPRHRVWQQPFQLASRPATCGEYIAFIDDGGYRRPQLRLSAGWDWVQAGPGGAPRPAPLYGRRKGDGGRKHRLQGEVDVDEHTPVCHLGHFEADAFAHWAGARLPTEAGGDRRARPRLAARGARAPASPTGGVLHPLAQSRPFDGTPGQLYGDPWEWTRSACLPDPGYRPAAGAIGEYNGKFMSGQMVLRGGSCATPAGHVRAAYRNFFPPGTQWQFSGVRLARDA